MAPKSISACIITYNEADHIDECLRSVAFCDDIVVVDSNSTDDTQARAETHGVRVITRDFDGFRSQKQFAVEQARHDWILSIDADERVTDELRRSIEQLCDSGFPEQAAYRFPRLSSYFGRFLRHGNAYPDHVLRLFNRQRGGWRGEREIHEAIGVDDPIKTIKGDLQHYPFRSLAEQVAKKERYAHMMAEHQFAKGKRTSLFKILFNPWWRFFRGYVLRAGFLDGWRGLVYALMSVEYVRRKYVKLWLLQKGQQP